MSNNFCLHSKVMRDFVAEHFEGIRAPFTAGIELTAKCNFTCVHCYCRPERGHDDLTTEEIKHIIDTLVERGLLELFFTGGEVFTRKDFADIYIYAKKKGLMVSVLSNISLLTEEHIALFKQYPVTQISTTMYGASEETYRRVTGVSGGYEKFMHSLQMLKENNIPFELKFIAMRQNIQDLYNIRGLGISLGVNMVIGFDVRPMVDGSQEPVVFRVTPEEAFEFDIKDELRRSFWEAIAKEEAEEENGMRERRIQYRTLNRCLYPCSVAHQFVFITSNGMMQGCVKTAYDQYDLRHGDFDEGWEFLKKQFIDKKASDTFKCISCDKKKYCEQCTANFVLEYGDAEKIDPFFCQIAGMRKRFIDGKKKEFAENSFKNKGEGNRG